jgi:hypothetical protein
MVVNQGSIAGLPHLVMSKAPLPLPLPLPLGGG